MASEPTSSPTRTPAAPPSQPGLLRILIAVVFAFFTYAATTALGFALMAAMGGSSVYEGDTWQLSTGAQVAMLLALAVAGFFAGTICRLIAGSARISLMFAMMMMAMLLTHMLSRHGSTDGTALRDANANFGTVAQFAHPGLMVAVGGPIVASLLSLAGGNLVGRVQRLFTGR